MVGHPDPPFPERIRIMKLPDPVQLAIPGFILLILVEIVWGKFRHTAKFEPRDTAASLTMGLGKVVAGIGSGLVIGAASLWLYQYRIFEIGYTWWAFVTLLFLDDFCYYWFHRLSHERRWLWASHIVHHSSQHYNLSTALRQTWTGLISGGWLIWLPLALLGFPPPMIIFMQGISLVYQFWIHTEAIDRMWAPIEWFFNTPSHHRVHHATNVKYLDRNYAGILIIWDKMFGTFEPEDPNEPCDYGLIHQIGTFNPLKIAFHEWHGIFKDTFSSKLSLKARFMYMFGPPGWSHDGSRQTVKQQKAELEGK